MGLKKTFLLVIVILLVWGAYRYSRPTPELTAVSALSVVKTAAPITLPWPAYGQGALAAQGYGVLEVHGQQKTVPMASIAKAVTALAVLRQKPLAVGEQGPIITITSDDVAIYNKYYSQDGSVVKVKEGEQLSEYQVLQALLIPSANNMADTLVRWAFGSQDAYLTYANKMLTEIGLAQTHVDDASGFASTSVSSSQDLARLGLAVIENPVLVGIVSQQTADLPVVGVVANVNWLLGSDGVFGIKTGNTTEAGGCFLFAAKRTIGGQSVTLIGALMQAPDLNTAIKDSRTIVSASDSGFETIKAASKGQTVASYETPWGARAEAIVKDDISVLAWRGSKLQTKVKLNEIHAPAVANSSVGSIMITGGKKDSSSGVVLKNDLSGPSWHWRILH